MREAAFHPMLARSSRAREQSGEWMGGRCGRTVGVYIQFNKLVAPVLGPSIQGSRMPPTHQLILGSTIIYNSIN
jgi:hypothetical protein